jgi:alkanesulfonate monooxygenase SsuD/methylene tetrahydromethanopterin reductase-like flavin-dependent oxidoreductase (luciferase family)
MVKSAIEFHLYLPQMRLSPSQLVERAQVAEAAGFLGIAGMDHLAPPLAEDQPMFSAMTTSTWLAAHTSRLIVSSLVLSDPFRHPAVLAQEAASLSHFSGGRFELGIGWGSGSHELKPFGVTSDNGAQRARRLRETIEILQALWTGDPMDYDGEFFQIRGARQVAVPVGPIPLVIGGASPNTMDLVAAHADWWNLHIAILGKYDEMRSRAGAARVSMEHMVALVPSEDQRAHVTELATKRFGTMGVFIGSANEIIDYFGALANRGIERIYAWFTDFAQPATLALFGETVIPALS